jgi:hypothetical protein
MGQIFIRSFDGSDMIHLEWLTFNWMESSHMLKKKIKMDMLAPFLDEDWKWWQGFAKRLTQVI